MAKSFKKDSTIQTVQEMDDISIDQDIQVVNQMSKLEQELNEAKYFNKHSMDKSVMDKLEQQKSIKMGNHFIERVVKFEEISLLKSTKDLIRYVIIRANTVLKRINNDTNYKKKSQNNTTTVKKLGYLLNNTIATNQKIPNNTNQCIGSIHRREKEPLT